MPRNRQKKGTPATKTVQVQVVQPSRAKKTNNNKKQKQVSVTAHEKAAVDFISKLASGEAKFPGDGDPTRTLVIEKQVSLPTLSSKFGYVKILADAQHCLEWSEAPATAVFNGSAHKQFVTGLPTLNYCFDTPLNVQNNPQNYAPVNFVKAGFVTEDDGATVFEGSYYKGDFTNQPVGANIGWSVESDVPIAGTIYISACNEAGPYGLPYTSAFNLAGNVPTAGACSVSAFNAMNCSSGFIFYVSTSVQRSPDAYTSMSLTLGNGFTAVLTENKTYKSLAELAPELEVAMLKTAQSYCIRAAQLVVTNSSALENRGGLLNVGSYPPGSDNTIPNQVSQLMEFVGSGPRAYVTPGLELQTGGHVTLMCHSIQEREFRIPVLDRENESSARQGIVVYSQPTELGVIQSQELTATVIFTLSVKNITDTDFDTEHHSQLNDQAIAVIQGCGCGCRSCNPNHVTELAKYAWEVVKSPAVRSALTTAAKMGVTTLAALL